MKGVRYQKEAVIIIPLIWGYLIVSLGFYKVH